MIVRQAVVRITAPYPAASVGEDDLAYLDGGRPPGLAIHPPIETGVAICGSRPERVGLAVY